MSQSPPPLFPKGEAASAAEKRLAAVEAEAIDPMSADIMRSAGYPYRLSQRVRALERQLNDRAIAEMDASAKEKDMPKRGLGWFERLLLKIALAKAAARGHLRADLAQRLKDDFSLIREL